VDDGELVRTFVGHGGTVTSVTFHPSGSLLVTAGEDRAIKIWDVATGRMERELAPDEDDDVFAVALSPDGKRLASVGNRDLTVKLWDVGTGQPLRTLAGHDDRAVAVAFGPDGQSLATSSRDGTVRLWDPATGNQARTFVLRAPRGPVFQVAYSHHSDRLATVNGNGTVTVLRLARINTPRTP
jgi:WD40 repeat protein